MELFQKIKVPGRITIAVICVLFFAGCSKTETPRNPLDVVFEHLTSEAGVRKWFIKKFYVNNVEQTLSTSQKGYYKTYTRSLTASYTATFLDENGYRGKAVLITEKLLKETIENNPGGQQIPIDIVINMLKDKEMDVEYTQNGVTIRTVYYAN